MKKLHNYILSNFSSIFYPIFFTLFAITSVISFIKMASASALLKVTFLELLLMYGYMLPLILFFSIPIVFFASAVVSLSKLSLDSELIVLFSLGISPDDIARIYLRLAILVSVLLFILSLCLIPISKQLNKAFVEEKKATASLNIGYTDFGQKFADWYLFSERDTKTNISSIVLFCEQEGDNFILAKDAKSINDKGTIQLSLHNGKAYIVKENEINQINFTNMVINNNQQAEITQYKDLVDYWAKSFIDDKRFKDLVTYVLISLFPILSIFCIVSFGVVNPRFLRNNSAIYMIVATLVYFVIVFVAVPKSPIISLMTIPILWIFVSYYIYKRYTLSRF